MNGLKTKIPATLLQIELLQKTYFEFVERNDLPGVSDFVIKNVSTNKVPLDARNEGGETPLTVSARLGYENLVDFFIRCGADVDAKDLEFWSPLLNAAKSGFQEIVELLVNAEADIEQADVGGWTPLYWAVYKNRPTVVKFLIQNSAEINLTDEYGMAPVLWSAGRGYSEILKDLVQAGARIDCRDRFGNNALFWACKKGCLESVTTLLEANCPLDVIGVNCATPLIMAVKGRHKEVVKKLLSKGPNVNTIDQDGMTALAYATQSGDIAITDLLLEAGAYVNIVDRKKESFLMKAVKSGQIEVVRALLAKYADVDAQDEEGRSALHIAIDKGHIDILALLVGHKPNTELKNKDGDTPLVKAVKCRNVIAVQLLVQIGAKVTACDKRGDTSLHISLRSRSKRLTQILLSRPQDSRLLYQPNKSGETPYGIDQSRSQPILPHIFGPAESQVQTEAMLGYDVYSNILADIVCEPLLSLPLTVGLYAKWGSGKSFLLNKLRESLALFSRSWMDAKVMSWSWVIFIGLFLMSSVVGTAVYSFSQTEWSLAVFLTTWVVLEVTYAMIVYGRQYYFRLVRQYLSSYFIHIRLLILILFYHPPTLLERDLLSRPVSFIFADYHRLSSIGGIHALANIVEKSYAELERVYGAMAVRLCSAFSPSYSSRSESELRRFCGLPIVAICATLVAVVIAALFMCASYFHDAGENNALLASGVSLLVFSFLLGVYPLARALYHASCLQPKRRIRRALSNLEHLRIEGVMQKLGSQIQLLEETLRRLDSYSSSQTRVVVFVDGLDTCEQERMLQTLDAIQILFGTKQSSPFILFIAVDPHIVVTAVQKNMGTVFTHTDLNGYDYLKNLIQMPFYLHNSAIQRLHERLTQIRRESFDYLRWKTMRPDNIYGSFLSLAESKAGSSRLRRGISQNLHEQHIGERIISDDYFTNINPRSMRRVVNSITVSGRMMRAFEINFNWIALGHWISLVEQWPYRLSWLIDYCEHNVLNDSTTLKEVYDIVRNRIPNLKTEDELVEIDRNTRNFELYLENNREPVLTVANMRSFAPFTSNLDPYLRKLIHDKYCGLPTSANVTEAGQLYTALKPKTSIVDDDTPDLFKDSAFYVVLCRLTANDVCSLLRKLPLSSSTAIEEYCSAFKSANITGLVLAHCNLSELKSQFHFSFGDWTIILLMVEYLRKMEKQILIYEANNKPGGSSTRYNTARQSRSHVMSNNKKQSTIFEQQVPSDMAEICATSDWLEYRLGHLDATDFVGDRDFPCDVEVQQAAASTIYAESPLVSRHSSLTRSEKPEDNLSVGSYADQMDLVTAHSVSSAPEQAAPLSPSIITPDDTSKTFFPTTATPVQHMNIRPSPPSIPPTISPRAKTCHVRSLVQAITGTVDETNRLLAHLSSEDDSDEEDEEEEEGDDENNDACMIDVKQIGQKSSRDTDEEDDETNKQNTVRCKASDGSSRPSVFDMTTTTTSRDSTANP